MRLFNKPPEGRGYYKIIYFSINPINYLIRHDYRNEEDESGGYSKHADGLEK